MLTGPRGCGFVLGFLCLVWFGLVPPPAASLAGGRCVTYVRRYKCKVRLDLFCIVCNIVLGQLIADHQPTLSSIECLLTLIMKHRMLNACDFSYFPQILFISINGVLPCNAL